MYITKSGLLHECHPLFTDTAISLSRNAQFFVLLWSYIGKNPYIAQDESIVQCLRVTMYAVKMTLKAELSNCREVLPL